MKIEIKKQTPYFSEYKITRSDRSTEIIKLETKTYFVHDICHYVVEKQLNYTGGFWRMLAQGYTFPQLFGKENPQTEDLRFIEKIVGPVQSIYLGYVPKEDFGAYIDHLNYNIPEEILNTCLAEISDIIGAWDKLEVGMEMELAWEEEKKV